MSGGKEIMIVIISPRPRPSTNIGCGECWLAGGAVDTSQHNVQWSCRSIHEQRRWSVIGTVPARPHSVTLLLDGRGRRQLIHVVSAHHTRPSAMDPLVPQTCRFLSNFRSAPSAVSFQPISQFLLFFCICLFRPLTDVYSSLWRHFILS